MGALNFPLRLQDTREDLVDVRQDTDDLKEYANAKLNRVTRYLGVLAERTRTLGLFPAPPCGPHHPTTPIEWSRVKNRGRDSRDCGTNNG